MTYVDRDPVELVASPTVWLPLWIWPQELGRKGCSIPQLFASARGRALSTPNRHRILTGSERGGLVTYLDEIVFWVFFQQFITGRNGCLW